MNVEDRVRILESLEPLFREALAKKLWFHSSYQDLWFSPAELRRMHAEGRFVWGPVNWKLRAPSEYLERTLNDVRSAQAAVVTVQQRIADSANAGSRPARTTEESANK